MKSLKGEKSVGAVLVVNVKQPAVQTHSASQERCAEVTEKKNRCWSVTQSPSFMFAFYVSGVRTMKSLLHASMEKITTVLLI